MRIIIGDRTRNAMKIIGVQEYPFTPEELSNKFRSLIKALHPDVNPSSDAKERSQQVIEAYGLLKNLALAAVSESNKTAAMKIFEEDTDMFSLWEQCPHCKGECKTKHVTRKGPCFVCNSFGISFFFHKGFRVGILKVVKCYDCKDGIFTLRNGRKVTCRKCKGTGKFEVKCSHCKGTGFVGEDKIDFVNCSHCNGVGRIKLNPFNPVIPKGAVMI